MHHQIFSSRNNSQGQRADIFGEKTFKIIGSLFHHTVWKLKTNYKLKTICWINSLKLLRHFLSLLINAFHFNQWHYFSINSLVFVLINQYLTGLFVSRYSVRRKTQWHKIYFLVWRNKVNSNMKGSLQLKEAFCHCFKYVLYVFFA